MKIRSLIISLGLVFSGVAFSTNSSDVNISLVDGVNQNLYVCRVGFRANNCENCNPGADKITVHLQNGANIDITYPESMDFSPSPQAIVASVALNSLDYSSGWFVTYCLDINKLASNPTNLSLAAVTGQIYVEGANDNGYIDQSKLNYLVTHSCGGSEAVISGTQENLWDLVKNNETSIFTTGPEPIILSSNPSMISRCTWTLYFQEISCTLRKINNVNCSNGALCTSYSTDISSGIDVTTE